MKITLDCYEAGQGSVGGLGTFHNGLYPELVKLGNEAKTFSMKTRESLSTRESIESVVIRRPEYPVSIDQAYAMVYDTFRRYDIDTSYVQPETLGLGYDKGYRFFTEFSCCPSPYRMSEVDLFESHDWMSFLKSGFFSLLSPKLPQNLGLHSTEPGRLGGISHHNLNGTSPKNSISEICFTKNNDCGSSFHEGQRIIRDLEFVLTYKILRENPDFALMTVSKIHRKEYLLGVRMHGGKTEKIQNRVYSMYHGVPINYMRPMKNVEKKDFTIGVMARCTPIKGFFIIPDLATILAHEAPEIKLHVATPADDKNPLYSFLRLSSLKLPNLKIDNTWYIGEEKVKIINSWHGMLSPSIYEPQGQTDLEAMSCGIVPIVGLGGFREKVEDGRTGVWINPLDVKETADKIIKLYRSSNGGSPYKGSNGYESKYDEMCKNAREDAEKRWSWEKRAIAHQEKNKYLLEGKAEVLREELSDLLTPKYELD